MEQRIQPWHLWAFWAGFFINVFLIPIIFFIMEAAGPVPESLFSAMIQIEVLTAFSGGLLCLVLAIPISKLVGRFSLKSLGHSKPQSREDIAHTAFYAYITRLSLLEMPLLIGVIVSILLNTNLILPFAVVSMFAIALQYPIFDRQRSLLGIEKESGF